MRPGFDTNPPRPRNATALMDTGLSDTRFALFETLATGTMHECEIKRLAGRAERWLA